MKKIHLIVDFMHVYYKHFFNLIKLDSKLKQLSCEVAGETLDTTLIYHTIVDIESFRRKFERDCEELTISICFDSKTSRKDEDSTYKERENRLSDNNFSEIDKIREILGNVKYNIYKEEGYEADDLVTSLVKNYKDEYDFTIVYTNDKDLLVNVDKNVGVMRFKAFKHMYEPVGAGNYETYLSNEFKCKMRYNSVLLYLSLVGDKTDTVKGIAGFGPKAYDKLISQLEEKNFDFNTLTEREILENVINQEIKIKKTKEENDLAILEGLDSLNKVYPRVIELNKPIKLDSEESRKEEYHKYSIFSIKE